MLARLAVIVGTIAIGLVFSRTITLPMHELIDRAARIGRGDREAFRPLGITAPASSRSCRTAFSTWPSSCRGARTISRPSRPISPTS